MSHDSDHHHHRNPPGRSPARTAGSMHPRPRDDTPSASDSSPERSGHPPVVKSPHTGRVLKRTWTVYTPSRTPEVRLDIKVNVAGQAAYALSKFCIWPNGAQAILDVSSLESYVELMHSPHPSVRSSICWMIAHLADEKSTAATLFDLNPCVRLVELLSDKYAEVIQGVTRAISKISQWPDGARAVVDAKATEHILLLLHSPDPRSVRHLAKHEANN
ncbi:hypothetical protein B0H11DRAFT_2218076 [Mycena galericulata]|nr:hypothetical protein B0H11DRAFT_2218076 [Mycena galericulata]